jgi:hypothetical protein
MRRHRAPRESRRRLEALATLHVARHGRRAGRGRLRDREAQARADRRVGGVGGRRSVRRERFVHADERARDGGTVRERVGKQHRPALARQRQPREIAQQHVGDGRHGVQLTGRM